MNDEWNKSANSDANCANSGANGDIGDSFNGGGLNAGSFQDVNANGIPDDVELGTHQPFPPNDDGIRGLQHSSSLHDSFPRSTGSSSQNKPRNSRNKRRERVKILVFVLVVVLMFGAIAGTFFYLSHKIDNFSLGDSFHDLSDTLSGKNAPQDPANQEENKKDIEKLQEYYDQQEKKNATSDDNAGESVDQQGLVNATPQERAVARMLMRIYSTCSVLKKIRADNSGDEQVTINQTGTALTLVSGPHSSMKVFECVVGRLDVPDASVNQMRARKETSETQKLEWGNYAAEWSYQKNAGLTLFVYPGSSASSSSSDPVLK